MRVKDNGCVDSREIARCCSLLLPVVVVVWLHICGPGRGDGGVVVVVVVVWVVLFGPSVVALELNVVVVVMGLGLGVVLGCGHNPAQVGHALQVAGRCGWRRRQVVRVQTVNGTA